MDRRRFIATTTGGAAAVTFMSWRRLSAASPRAAEAATTTLAGSRPNVVFVLTDDQGYGDLGCHGHPLLKTPNLDRLYSQSTRFTDFHVSPSCAPTRSAILSGRLPFHVGITHTIAGRDRMSLDARTVAETLKTAGYTTGVFGKWHTGDEAPYQPDRRGFDEVFIHGGGGIGQTWPGSHDVPGNRHFDPAILHNGTLVRTKGYCTDVFTHQALGWIKRNRDKPFFAYLAFNAPHDAIRTGQEKFPCPDRFRDPYGDLGRDKAGYLGMIANIDANIGLLMRKLDEWGLADNTLVVFMSDNGPATKHSGGSSGGFKGDKGDVHEGGTRMPAFFRWPGRLRAGLDIDRLARHVDIFPTVAALAGAALPKGYDIDGRSLLPLMQDPKAEWADRYTFFHNGRWPKGKADDWKYRNFAVRNQRWRLVDNRELYDIQADPFEQRNVYDDHPDVVREMMAAYDEWWGRVRPCMVNENAVIEDSTPFVTLYWNQVNPEGKPRGQLTAEDRKLPAWEPPDIGEGVIRSDPPGPVPTRARSDRPKGKKETSIPTLDALDDLGL